MGPQILLTDLYGHQAENSGGKLFLGKWQICLESGLFKGLRLVPEGFVVTMLVRNSKSNPESVSPRDLTYCSHKPECMVTTNPRRSVLILIITGHFQFHPVNVSILHLKYEHSARRESHFACYPHCYVTWCPFSTGIVGSQFPSSRDAALMTHYLRPFISACLNSLKRFLPQQNIYTNNLQT